MRLKIENMFHVGVLDDHPVDFAISGSNDEVQQRAVSRALFCMYSAFYDYEERLAEMRKHDLCDSMQRYGAITPSFVNRLEGIDLSFDISEDDIGDLLQCVTARQSYDLSDVQQQLEARLRLSVVDLQKVVIERYWHAAFNGQSLPVDSAKPSRLSLLYRESTISATFEEDRCIDYACDHPLFSRAIHIESPFVLSGMSFYDPREMQDPNKMYSAMGHAQALLFNESESDSICESVIHKEKVQPILDAIQKVVPGRFVFVSDMDVALLFQPEGSPVPLRLGNVPLNHCPFLMIKRLLEVEALTERSILIWDSPEQFLSEDMQKKFADVLFMLNDVLGVKLMVTSGSAEFRESLGVNVLRKRRYVL